MAKFELLIDELGLKKSSPRTVELLLEDDIPARIILHPNDEIIVVPLYFYDAATLSDEARSGVFESLLLLNDFSAQQSLCYVGMDDKDLLVLIGLVSLSDLNEEEFLFRLSRLDEQARRYKDLVVALAKIH